MFVGCGLLSVLIITTIIIQILYEIMSSLHLHIVMTQKKLKYVNTTIILWPRLVHELGIPLEIDESGIE
jgi:uncharacterized protein YebE (UPF0316 family)